MGSRTADSRDLDNLVRRSFGLIVAAWLAAASAFGLPPETLQLLPPVGDLRLQAEPIEVTIEIAREGYPLETVAVDWTDLRQPLRLDLRPRATGRQPFELDFTAEGLWIPTWTSGPESTTDILTYRATEIEASIVTDDGGPLDQLTVEVVGAPDSNPELRGHGIVCPIAEGRLHCSVPAVAETLRLVGHGYAPAYRPLARWAEAGPAPQIRLRTGASLIGWARLDESLAPHRVRASLRRATRNLGGTADQPHGDSARDTSIDRHGFFQFTGLEIARYWLEFLYDDQPVHRTSVTVRGGETRLDAVDVAGLGEIELRIQPPLAGEGVPWLVVLSTGTTADQRVSDVAAEGFASFDGGWTGFELLPGRYDLSLQALDGARWLARTVDIESGRQSLVVDVEIVPIQGTVSIGDEPAEAVQLWFGGQWSDERFHFETDDDGVFSGFVNQEGIWEIDLETAYQTIPLTRGAEVELDPELGIAPVAIRIPATRIEGRVLDPGGARLDAGSVHVLAKSLDADRPRTRRLSTSWIDDAGRFQLLGLTPGDYQLQAKGDSSSSESVRIRLDEDRPIEDVVLHLEPWVHLSGVVTSSGRPLAGASLFVEPKRLGDEPGVWGQKAVTDVGGRFWLEIPARSTAHILVVAPGHATTILGRPIPKRDSDHFDLPVDRAAGSLRLDLTGTTEDQDFFYSTFIWRDGVPIRLAQILSLGGAMNVLRSPPAFELPSMAPGNYRVCVRSGYCSSGFLAPQSTLTLPVTDPQEARP